jgi:hypothetical protein
MSFFFDFSLYLKFLQDRKKTLGDQLLSIEAELHSIDEQIAIIQNYYEPKVSISISKYTNGSERFIGRFKATFPDGTSKQVAINLGPIGRFTGKSDPKLIELAKKKASERYNRINPNLIKDGFDLTKINKDFIK